MFHVFASCCGLSQLKPKITKWQLSSCSAQLPQLVKKNKALHRRCKRLFQLLELFKVASSSRSWFLETKTKTNSAQARKDDSYASMNSSLKVSTGWQTTKTTQTASNRNEKMHPLVHPASNLLIWKKTPIPVVHAEQSAAVYKEALKVPIAELAIKVTGENTFPQAHQHDDQTAAPTQKGVQAGVPPIAHFAMKFSLFFPIFQNGLWSYYVSWRRFLYLNERLQPWMQLQLHVLLIETKVAFLNTWYKF